MNMIARNVLLLAALSSTWGCSSGNAPVDIGDGRTGEKLEDYAALWEGYAEANDFADGSDKVKIALDGSGNGTLEIGDTALWPAATDPDVGYPPNFGRNDSLVNLLPGVLYPIHLATVESARIRLSVNPYEIEGDWCALQTSYPAPAGGGVYPYTCMAAISVTLPPNAGAGLDCSYDNNDDKGVIALDCVKGKMCGEEHACSCDADGCSFFSDPGAIAIYTKLDAALADAGNSLVGTLRFGAERQQKSITVRLQRVSSD